MTAEKHRDDCQAEFVDGAMAWTGCECREKRITEIRIRESQATPGPWVYEPPQAIDGGGLHYVSTAVAVADDDPPLTSFFDEGDARFTAAVREDVPFLLADNDRLRAALAAAEEARQAWAKTAQEQLRTVTAQFNEQRITSLDLESDKNELTAAIQRVRDLHDGQTCSDRQWRTATGEWTCRTLRALAGEVPDGS